jgi:chaperonin cofactor prefoldin
MLMDKLETLKNEIFRLKSENRLMMAKIDKLKRQYNRLSRPKRCTDDECSCHSMVPNDSDMD